VKLVDDGPTFEDLSSLLALYLLDLRAQYEAELRSLTAAQRALEHYRTAATDEARRQFKITLSTELRALAATSEAVRDGLNEALRQAGLLEPSDVESP
jgi:hypothetical protein